MQHRLHIRPARKPSTPLPPSRNRALYALLFLAVIAIGLIWRSNLIPLPPSASNHGGDALWALMVFLGFGIVLPRVSTSVLSIVAVSFAWGVEFSQLYQAPWIDAVRATLPGRLVLGTTFHWPDLLAYAMGVGLGALVASRWRR